jgi:hypothetical protein
MGRHGRPREDGVDRYAPQGRLSELLSVAVADKVECAVPKINRSDFSEVTRRFERWRMIARMVGQEPYDEPDFGDGRLYFRYGFTSQATKWPDAATKGDWSAYVIECSGGGLFNVIRSLWHERDFERSEDLEAVFSRPEDAGKYVIAQVADSIRIASRTGSQFTNWEQQGLDSTVSVASPPESLIQYFVDSRPGTRLQFAEEYLKKYSLGSDPAEYGVTLPANWPYMQVISLSFDEVDTQLLDGLPLETVPRLQP